MKEKLKIKLIPSIFVDKKGKFNLKKALNMSGKFAGVCYNEEGYEALENEKKEKTERRIVQTLKNGHHSVYDHISVTLNIKNIPKIIAMFLNNEKQYTTSEKSARYVTISSKQNPSITSLEEQLYNKWVVIFEQEILKKYGSEPFINKKIKYLAQENARYLISVFTPTTMIYTTSLRQINNIAAFCQEFIANYNPEKDFDSKVAQGMIDLYYELLRLNLIQDDLESNIKNRKFSLFNEEISSYDEFFENKRYTLYYPTSFSALAQAQRHRTIDYSIKFPKTTSFFIPPIIKDNANLHNEWINDMEKLKLYYPQGQIIFAEESATYDDFILKLKERLCSCAQLEINNQTNINLKRIVEFSKEYNLALYKKMNPYTNGARCTFNDYTCNNDCQFKEGKILVRKI